MTGTSPPEQPTSDSRRAVALGAVLVVLGVVLFAGQLAGIGIGDLGWPLWIIGAGAAILLIGLVLVPEQAIAIGGTVVTVVGLVLLYQATTDHWESWAYAWALVGPAASGFGMMLWGVRDADRGAMRNGLWGMLGGLAIFAIGFVFFEQLIGISGRQLDLPEWTLPALVIVVGVVLLARGVMDRAGRDASAS